MILVKVTMMFCKNNRWEHVMEYSREINSLLANSESSGNLVIEDPKALLKVIIDFSIRYCFVAAYLIFRIQYLTGPWKSERGGANQFKSCMGADGNILCRQAI